MGKSGMVNSITILIWFKAVLLFACALNAFGDDQNPPNVVLIFVDDLGYCASGLYGCDAPTPNIQQLADEGARFTDGYVTSPVCSPSRAGLLTGRSQQRFGHDYLPEGEPDGNGGLPADEITLADAMKKAGYVTGSVGKWHLGHNDEFHPLNRGFDEFFGLLGAASSYADHAREDLVVRTLWGIDLPLLSYSPNDLTLWGAAKAFFFEPGAPLLIRGTDQVEEDSYLTDAFSREAVDFINRHRDKPFFLYLPYTAVHHPLQAPREYYDQFSDIEDEQIRILTAMTASLDDGVGSVLNALQVNGLEDNTLVFFISDNGAGADGVSNAPLRLGKHSLFEGGNRVPFVVKWPGNIPAGLTYRHPVSTLDVFPTSLAAAGAGLAKELTEEREGVDLLPYLTESEGTPPHESLFWRQGPNWAVRSGHWKLTFAADRYWLYDLSKDVGEKNNLAGSQPEKIRQLTEQYREWNSHNTDPAWPAFSSKTMSELSVDDVAIEWVF